MKLKHSGSARKEAPASTAFSTSLAQTCNRPKGEKARQGTRVAERRLSGTSSRPICLRCCAALVYVRVRCVVYPVLLHRKYRRPEVLHTGSDDNVLLYTASAAFVNMHLPTSWSYRPCKNTAAISGYTVVTSYTWRPRRHWEQGGRLSCQPACTFDLPPDRYPSIGYHACVGDL